MDNVSGRGHGGPSSNAPSELVEAIPAVIYEAEPGAEGSWRYVSGHIRTLLGYTPEEWTADPTLYVRSLHPYDREAVVRIEDREIDAARSGDVTAVSEYRMLTKDGGVVWVRDEARIAGDESSPVWQGLLIDITAERALADAYDNYRSLVESLPAALYRSEPGPAGRWTFLSPQVEGLVGYSAAELMSDADLRAALVHPDDRERVLAEEAEDLEADSGKQWVREYRLLHRLGRQVWVRDRGIVSGGLGAKRTVEGIITDISATHSDAGTTAAVPDVYRLSCPKCGSVWASEQIEVCAQCGNSDVDEVSLDATLRELSSVSAQLEGLLDGIQGHLEMLKTSLPEPAGIPERPALGRLRVVTPLHEDPDVL